MGFWVKHSAPWLVTCFRVEHSAPWSMTCFWVEHSASQIDCATCFWVELLFPGRVHCERYVATIHKQICGYTCGFLQVYQHHPILFALFPNAEIDTDKLYIQELAQTEHACVVTLVTLTVTRLVPIDTYVCVCVCVCVIVINFLGGGGWEGKLATKIEQGVGIKIYYSFQSVTWVWLPSVYLPECGC